MGFPGTKWYVVTVRSPQLVRDQKTFGKHWVKETDNFGMYHFWVTKKNWTKEHHALLPQN